MKRILTGLLVGGVALIGLTATATSASAHTPNATAGCDQYGNGYVTISAKDYSAADTNTISYTVDGETLLDDFAFKTAYSATFPVVPPTVKHTASVSIKTSADKDGKLGYAKTYPLEIPVCKAAPPSSTPPSSTPPSSTPPPASTPPATPNLGYVVTTSCSDDHFAVYTYTLKGVPVGVTAKVTVTNFRVGAVTLDGATVRQTVTSGVNPGPVTVLVELSNNTHTLMTFAYDLDNVVCAKPPLNPKLITVAAIPGCGTIHYKLTLSADAPEAVTVRIVDFPGNEGTPYLFYSDRLIRPGESYETDYALQPANRGAVKSDILDLMLQGVVDGSPLLDRTEVELAPCATPSAPVTPAVVAPPAAPAAPAALAATSPAPELASTGVKSGALGGVATALLLAGLGLQLLGKRRKGAHE